MENSDKKAESIAISYKEFHTPDIKKLENFELLGDSQQKVPLPKGFEKWKELAFEVEGQNKSVFNATLKKFKIEANVLWTLNWVAGHYQEVEKRIRTMRWNRS